MIKGLLRDYEGIIKGLLRDYEGIMKGLWWLTTLSEGLISSGLALRGHALILMNWQPNEASKMLVDCTGSVHGIHDRFHKYTDHKHVDTKNHGYTHSTFKRNKTLVRICHTQCNTLHESTVPNPYKKMYQQKNLSRSF